MIWEDSVYGKVKVQDRYVYSRPFVQAAKAAGDTVRERFDVPAAGLRVGTGGVRVDRHCAPAFCADVTANKKRTAGQGFQAFGFQCRVTLPNMSQ